MEPGAQTGSLEEGAPWLVLEGVEHGQVQMAGGHPRRGTRLRTAGERAGILSTFGMGTARLRPEAGTRCHTCSAGPSRPRWPKNPEPGGPESPLSGLMPPSEVTYKVTRYFPTTSQTGLEGCTVHRSMPPRDTEQLLEGDSGLLMNPTERRGPESPGNACHSRVSLRCERHGNAQRPPNEKMRLFTQSCYSGGRLLSLGGAETQGRQWGDKGL